MRFWGRINIVKHWTTIKVKWCTNGENLQGLGQEDTEHPEQLSDFLTEGGVLGKWGGEETTRPHHIIAWKIFLIRAPEIQEPRKLKNGRQTWRFFTTSHILTFTDGFSIILNLNEVSNWTKLDKNYVSSPEATFPGHFSAAQQQPEQRILESVQAQCLPLQGTQPLKSCVRFNSMCLLSKDKSKITSRMLFLSAWSLITWIPQSRMFSPLGTCDE